MDRTDLGILALLQEDSSLPVAEIAGVPLKNVISRFAMARVRSTAACPLPEPRGRGAARPGPKSGSG